MENIKRVLKEKGVSMSELARRMGLDSSTVIRKFANGGCSIDFVLRVSQALDVPAYKLLMPDNKMVVDVVQEVEPAVVCPHCVNPIDVGVSEVQVEVVE